MHGLARTTDPITSHEAAAQVDVTKLQRVIMEHLAHGGMTTSDIAAASGIPRDSLSPRMKTLVSKGMIIDTGRKEIPKCARIGGRTQIVWEAR